MEKLKYCFVFDIGGLYGNTDSSTSSQEDPAATHFVAMMKKQLRKDSYNRQSKRDQQLPGDMATNKATRKFVFRKFKGEMLFMFSFLPEKKRCDILVSLSVSTKCNLTSTMHILSNESILKTPQEVKCFSKRTLRYPQCRTKDTMNILNGFWNQMGRLFNNISVPFQCNIIHRITTTSLKYRRQRQNDDTKIKAPRITLQTAEKQLELIFPYLTIKEKCSKVWKPLKKLVPLRSPASLLNLTVKLGAGVKRKDWLRSFKKKAYQIYRIYYNHYYQSMRKRLRSATRERPLLPNRRPSNPPSLRNNDVRLNILRVTKIRRTISVVFGMEVRRPRIHVYNRISPAKLVIIPLKRLGIKALNSFFNATVVKLSGAQPETSKEKYIWSVPQIVESKRQFPPYLMNYYRKLDRGGRCLVMLYISSHLQTDLRPVEMLYSTFKYIPRKYFCSSKRRIPISPVANRTDIYMERHHRQKPANKPTSLPYTTNKNKILVRVNAKQTNTSRETEDFPEDSEDQEAEEQEITPLEIGLFAILGLLCLAILAFTINCVLFTIKKKKSAPPQQVNTEFSRAVFRRETNGTPEDVKVVLNGEPNTVENSLTRHCHHSNGPSTSQLCTQNNPKTGEVALSEEEICLHSNAHSLESSLNRKDETVGEDSLTGSKEISDEVTVDISDNDNCSEHCSKRTNSQCSVHDSRSSISLSSVTELNSSALAAASSQRTLKECSGELEVISDDDNDHVRSASCSSESDPGSKNSTKKLFVHLDQSSDKETAT